MTNDFKPIEVPNVIVVQPRVKQPNEKLEPHQRMVGLTKSFLDDRPPVPAGAFHMAKNGSAIYWLRGGHPVQIVDLQALMTAWANIQFGHENNAEVKKILGEMVVKEINAPAELGPEECAICGGVPTDSMDVVGGCGRDNCPFKPVANTP